MNRKLRVFNRPNFQDVMNSRLKSLDVSVQNLEVMQQAYKKTQAKT